MKKVLWLLLTLPASAFAYDFDVVARVTRIESNYDRKYKNEMFSRNGAVLALDQEREARKMTSAQIFHRCRENHMFENMAKIVFMCFLFSCVSTADAALAYRTAVVDGVEADSATRPGYENLMYVYQTGSWIGSSSCHPTIAYINTQDNPYFAGMILSARIHSLPLRVYVDDSLPKISGNICQVINLKF